MKYFLPGIAFLIYFLSVGCHPTSKFVALKYDSATIRARLDSGVKSFIFQFYNPKMNKSKSHFRVISYPDFDSMPYHTPDTLTMVKDSSRVFNDKVTLGNNTISRADIEYTITDNSNNWLNYKYILFVPTRVGGHVVYTLYPVLSHPDSSFLFVKPPVTTNPCPPDCPHN
jgi:hypothetical protein